ncbi:MAG: archease [Anaerolineae bacterium]|nr:archease [Anaerolineae bacterium]
MDERFEEIEHTADVAIRVRGGDLAGLFANAAYGMAWQLADPEGVDPTIERSVELEAYDVETLLVAWLGELLYLGERDGCVFTEFDMREVAPTRLRAVARGGAAREYRGHVKAVTFNELEIRRTGTGYETTVVFDV